MMSWSTGKADPQGIAILQMENIRKKVKGHIFCVVRGKQQMRKTKHWQNSILRRLQVIRKSLVVEDMEEGAPCAN